MIAKARPILDCEFRRSGKVSAEPLVLYRLDPGQLGLGRKSSGVVVRAPLLLDSFDGDKQFGPHRIAPRGRSFTCGLGILLEATRLTGSATCGGMEGGSLSGEQKSFLSYLSRIYFSTSKSGESAFGR